MDGFAATCEAVAATESRPGKVRIAASWLATLDLESIGLGACFLAGRPFSRVDARRLRVGSALLVRAAVQLSGYDAEVVRACARATGDPGEALGLLAPGFSRSEAIGLRDARRVFDDLSRTRDRSRRLELLVDVLGRLSPAGAKFFVKLLCGGLRTGLLEKQVEEVVAVACGADRELVRAACVRSGDLEAVARAAREGRLAEVRANLFHPIDFMLANPVASPAEVEAPAAYLVERKYDGVRAQAHVAAGRRALFARGLGEVTGSFPEVAAALGGLRGPAVLDGELVAVDGARSLPFALLQRRLSCKAPSEELQREVPVVFVAFDLLHDPGGLLFDAPLEERLSRLSALTGELGDERLRLAARGEASSTQELERLFADAREGGDEGLVLKRRGSTYAPGRRGTAWLELRRARGTLVVVVTAAEPGHGQRASMLSDFTFAVRDGDQFVNVGKAFTGLTDADVRELTRRLQAATLERFGRVRLVRPEVVLEVAFDGVRRSTRHKSGFALRFPRIVRLRDDKLPHEADTIDRVRDLHEAVLDTGRAPPRSTLPPAPTDRPAGTVDDLPLFKRR